MYNALFHSVIQSWNTLKCGSFIFEQNQTTNLLDNHCSHSSPAHFLIALCLSLHIHTYVNDSHRQMIRILSLIYESIRMFRICGYECIPATTLVRRILTLSLRQLIKYRFLVKLIDTGFFPRIGNSKECSLQKPPHSETNDYFIFFN